MNPLSRNVKSRGGKKNLQFSSLKSYSLVCLILSPYYQWVTENLNPVKPIVFNLYSLKKMLRKNLKTLVSFTQKEDTKRKAERRKTRRYSMQISNVTADRPHGLGLLPEDPGLQRTKSSLLAEKVYKTILNNDLPPKLDVRLREFPVRDQGQQGSCVAFAMMAIAQNLEYHDSTMLKTNLSTQYAYNQRVNYPSEGMYISDAMRIIKENGVVRESDFSYGGSHVGGRDKIPQKVFELGQKYKMGEVVWINTLDGLKKSIFSCNAGIILTFKVYNYSQHFWRQGNGDELIGHHAVAAVGYDDAKQHIIIQNSWGNDWGDRGYTYLPYDEFNKHVHSEAVAFVDVKGSPPFPKEEEQKKCCNCVLM